MHGAFAQKEEEVVMKLSKVLTSVVFQLMKTEWENGSNNNPPIPTMEAAQHDLKILLREEAKKPQNKDVEGEILELIGQL